MTVRLPNQISVDTSVAARHRARTPNVAGQTRSNAPPQANAHNGQNQALSYHGGALTQQQRSRSKNGGKQGKPLALVMPESLQRSSMARSPTQSAGTPTSVASAFTPTGATRHYDPTLPAVPGSASTPPKRPRKSALRKKSLSRLSGILRQTRSSGNLRSSARGTQTFGSGRSSGSGSGGVSSEDYAQTGHNNPLTKPITMPKGPSRATMMRQESLKKFQSLMKTRPDPPTPPLPMHKRAQHPMPKSILINRRQSKDNHDRSQTQSAGQAAMKPQTTAQQSSGALPAYPSASGGSVTDKREGIRYNTRSSRAEPPTNSRKSAAVSVFDISADNNIEVVDDISSAFAKAANKRLPPTPQETPPKKQTNKSDALGSYFAVHPPIGRQSQASVPSSRSTPAKTVTSPPLPKGDPVQTQSLPSAQNTKPKNPNQPELSQERLLPDAKAKENAEIMSRLEEERRAIRMQNRENFNSRVWGPALSNELAEAMRLAAERSGTTEASEPLITEDDERKRYTLPPIQPLFIKKKPTGEEEKRSGSGLRESETDWAHGVKLAMAKLENRIQVEAKSDPKAFMRARRESAQLRAWVASQKRASEARLSALASGRARPQSPFEQEFVAQLMKESDEVRLKKSESPMADADRLFRGSNMTGMTGLTGTTASFGAGTLPRYTPFSLAPLREMEDETSSTGGTGFGQQACRTDSVGRDTRPAPAPMQTSSNRMSAFEEKKAARRAGSKDYKTFSSAWSTSDVSVNPGVFCCNLGKFWKPDKLQRAT